MATARKPSQLQRLAEEFPPEAHKTRSQGGQQLTYLSIDSVINRLNEVLGTGWGTDAKTDVTLLDSGKYLAVCELKLKALIDGTETVRYGVGAMVNGDPDMAAKTALAEAIKKAGHALGVGLYLWDPAARDRVEKKKKLAKGSSAALKQEVFALARERTGLAKPTAAQIGALFGVDPGALADDDTLRSILEQEGVL